MENEPGGFDWRINLLLAVLIATGALAIRALLLSHPAEIIFDEFYYVDAAQKILQGEDDPNWVHPHVGKYLIGSGIILFGDNSFGWRIIGVVFGSISVFLIYYLAMELFQSTSSALVASFLLAIDPLHFVQTRIAMLDTYFLPFVILAFYSVLRHFRDARLEGEEPKAYSHWLLISGISIGIGLTTKWSTALAIIGVIVIYVLYSLRHRETQFIRGFRTWGKRVAILGSIFVVIPLSIFVSSFSLDFHRGTSLNHWLSTQYAIIDFQTTVTSEHPYMSPAWTWILNLNPMLYYLDESANAIIRAEGNNIAWWFSIIAVGYISYRAVRGGRIAAFVVIAIATQYLPWFISPRTTYLFYFFPTLPFIYLASAYLLTIFMSWEYKKFGLILTLVYLLSVLGLFTYAFPTYIGVSQMFWSNLVYGID